MSVNEAAVTASPVTVTDLGVPEPLHAPALMTATVTSFTPDVAVVSLTDGTEALLPVTEYLDTQRWRVGTQVPVVIDRSGPRTLASTADERVVTGLLDGFVPELRTGKIMVVGVARHAGVRTKIAVATTDPDLDPVAACVGRAANRVRALSDALGGEKVDVIPWHPDRLTFAKNALAPAKVESLIAVTSDAVEAFVPRHQMAAAVGEGGLNSMLAGLLAGLSITVIAA